MGLNHRIMTRDPWPGDIVVAREGMNLKATSRLEFVLRPEWKSYPVYKGDKDVVPWEWKDQPVVCHVVLGEMLFVVAHIWDVVDPAPPNWQGTCDWPMILVQKLQTGHIGWCKAWDVDVPLL